MPSPAATALDTTDEHSTTALYRAAIGSVNAAYYLPLFSRFEAAGRGGLSWNWAAALYTLNWLAFRRLWHAALVYGGVVVLLLLGVLGIGRLVYQFSDSTQWGLIGGLLVLAILLPGLGGNAVLFAATRQRVQAALKATTTVAEACAMLERQAPGRRGLIIQMVGNAVALGLAAYSWSQFTGMEPLPTALPKAESARSDARNVAVGRTTDAASAPVALPAASAPVAVASAPNPAPAPTPAASAAQPAASAPVPAASGAWTPPSAPLPPLAAAASAPAVASAASSPTKGPTEQAANTRATSPDPLPAKQPAQATATPAKSVKPVKPTASVASPTAAPAARSNAARQTNPSPSVELLPSALPQGNAPQALRFSVNVGSYTDENQALNAYVRLTDARLPATQQTFVDRNGPRVVLRVGPFDTAAEAEAAADRVKALGLGAQLQPLPRR